jgi:hypothetical protein
MDDQELAVLLDDLESLDPQANLITAFLDEERLEDVFALPNIKGFIKAAGNRLHQEG